MTKPAPSCGSLPSNDDVLADAIKHARVVVGQAGSPTPQPRADAEMALQTGFAFSGPDPTPFLVTFPGLLRNVLPIEQAAAGRGLFSINPETRRHHPPRANGHGSARRAGAVAEPGNAAGREPDRRHCRACRPQARRAVGGGTRPRSSNRRQGQIWVHFNKNDPARYVSAKDVLQGSCPTDRLRGKLVLIGTSAIGLLDLKTTPVEAVMPGVEVHAQILESVLTKSLLVSPAYAIGAELIVAVLLGLAIIIAAPMLSARSSWCSAPV